jgi:hypothetical protein
MLGFGKAITLARNIGIEKFLAMKLAVAAAVAQIP